MENERQHPGADRGDVDFCLPKLRPHPRAQFLCTQAGSLEGAGHPGCEAEVQHIFPASQTVTKGLKMDRWPDLRGGCKLAGPLGGVKSLHRNITAGAIYPYL